MYPQGSRNANIRTCSSCSHRGIQVLMIEANDTDIVVIDISLVLSLAATGLEKMWVAFGKGEHSRCIPIHELVSAIGQEKTSGMLFFHAFIGCDE